MTHGAESKIEKLIEEANANAAALTSKWRGGDKLALVPDPTGIIPTIGNMYAGYKAGGELGHPVAGTLIGQEGALGAKSKHDGSVEVGDAYAKENVLKRALQGGVAGLAAGALSGNPVLAAGTGLGTAALYAGATPGVRYGLGKLFGGKPTVSDKKG